MQTHNFFCPTRIIVGAGSHGGIAEIVSSLKSERVFLVVDRALLSSEVMGNIAGSLQIRNIAVATYSDIEPDPSDLTVDRAFAQCREHRTDTVLALGGGSTIDVAKAVAILSTNGGRIHDYEGIDVYRTPPLPLIAIPSTAGTGSEVSGSCVITDTSRNLKMSIRHAAMNPAKIAILDPLALVSMPAHVAMHSGMDAFVHAFESFISRNANPFTDALNLRAIELIASNIRTFVTDRGNLEAGTSMLVGSSLAGMAFGLTGLGNVHCMARFVGAFFHLSHGLSNAICLPFVASFNRPAAVDRYARLAAILSPEKPADPESASHMTVDAIARLCRDLGVPHRLRDVGAGSDRLEEIAGLCVEAGYDRWNPRATSRDDFLHLLHCAY